ncbi:MAG: hypothetical protein ACFB2W_15215 [Leptolyngbyaceae cyanobacterium]
MKFLKVLFNPIFLLAAGLHAGFLLIPVAGGSSEDLVPAPDPEGESITVTRIPPKGDSPANPSTGQNAPAKRPTAGAQTASANQTAAGSGTRQPRSQSDKSQSPGGQRSSGSSDVNDASNDDQAQSPSANNSAPGLPDLPAEPDVSNTEGVSVAVSPAEPAAQAAPTLIALKESADDRSIPQRLQDFLARLQYGWQGTREGVAADAQAAWIAELPSAIQTASPQKLEKPLDISYPVTIEAEEGPRQIYSCLNPIPKPGRIGAVVAADGTISGDPELLRSSGYPFLNDVALKQIQDYEDFPVENTQKVYTVPFEVNYDEDACLGLAELSVAP